MMKTLKKVVLLILLCFWMFMLTLRIYDDIEYTLRYRDWQTIFIEEIKTYKTPMTFKVPDYWVFTRKDDVIYFTDKPIDDGDYKIYLVGSIGFLREDEEYWAAHILFDDVERIGTTKNPSVRVMVGNSIGVRCWQNDYRVGDEIVVKEVIIFPAHDFDSSIYFTSWDYSMDEDILTKIVLSYSSTQGSGAIIRDFLGYFTMIFMVIILSLAYIFRH